MIMPKNKWYCVKKAFWFTSKKAEKKYDRIVEALSEANEEAVVYHGYEMALVGIAHRFGMEPVAAYDRSTCIAILMDRDEMTHEDAEDYFGYNTLGTGVDNAPIFVEMAEDIP
jgi:hypothetical protein